MKKDKARLRQVVAERVRQLFSLARQTFRKDPALSDRYVALARKMAMKHRFRMPRELKRQFCKHCGSYLVPGANVRVRTQRGKVVLFCMVCRHLMRFPYAREKKGH